MKIEDFRISHLRQTRWIAPNFSDCFYLILNVP